MGGAVPAFWRSQGIRSGLFFARLAAAGKAGAAFGFGQGARYLIGLWFGNNLTALLVVSGVAAAAMAEPTLKRVLLFGSVAYLLYLGARIAFAGAEIAFIRRARPPGFPGGTLLQLINPKAYAVHTALFSAFAFMPDDPWAEVALKFAIMNALWIPIHVAWLWAGVTLNRLDLEPATQRAINMAMAAAMLGVVGLAVWSSF